MSKFRIYKTDMKDPRSIGRMNKWVLIIISAIYLLILLISNSLRTSFSSDTLRILNYALLAIFTITILFFFVLNRMHFSRIRNIGFLEFKRSVIIKILGDLRTEYPVDGIERIELENHISDLKISQQKDTFLTYIIRIVNRDKSSDQFVIAAKSDDYKQKIFITDTLNLLKKLSDLEVTINTNNKK